jgi:hypothetical protein
VSGVLIRVPCGSQQKLRFGFPRRELTDAELETFEAGGSLPDGTGVDPPTVLLEFQKPHNDQTEVVDIGIVREATGEYHLVLPIDMDQDGTWQWRGRGEEEDGSPFACTPPQSFEAYRTF